MINYAILDGKAVVPVEDHMTWAKWFEENFISRHVADDEINGIRISTVFIGIDHSFGRGRSKWFETMIFGGKHDQYQDRYETWEQAEAGHQKAIALVARET